MIKYDKTDDYKYRVLETFSIDIGIIPPEEIRTNFEHLAMNGVLTVYKGCLWDGPTGAFDTDNTMLGSLVHDVLCYFMSLGLLSYKDYWKPAAALLRKHCEMDGMAKPRARWIEKAVVTHGKLRYKV